MAVDDAAEREFLLWLAQSDERAMVRSTAWSALLSEPFRVRLRVQTVTARSA